MSIETEMIMAESTDDKLFFTNSDYQRPNSDQTPELLTTSSGVTDQDYDARDDGELSIGQLDPSIVDSLNVDPSEIGSPGETSISNMKPILKDTSQFKSGKVIRLGGLFHKKFTLEM